MRGSAVLMRRSRNSYIVAPRKVTFAPMAWFSRSLKLAMLFLARVSIGFWPVMVDISFFASSSAASRPARSRRRR